MGTLAGDVEAVERAVNRVRRAVRQWVWGLVSKDDPIAGISAACPLVIGIDATLVGVHLRRGGCGADLESGFGYHPLTAWFDHGSGNGGA